MEEYFLYILKSDTTGRRYIGSTGNLDERFKKHNRGGVRSTKPYLPWRILHTEHFSSRTEARRREMELKRNSKKREMLYDQIDGPIV